jgi:hypothetical protein
MVEKATSFKASILSIADDVRTKKNSKQFLLCTVKFQDGPLAGKSYFAQRTLGGSKASIKVGQDVICHMSLVDNNPFFEISTGGQVTDKAEIIAALGLK